MKIAKFIYAIAFYAIRRIYLGWFRLRSSQQLSGSAMRFLGYKLKITDVENFYIQYKDEFINKIYHFQSQRSNPFIIDGGSNMGMSILRFKNLYPQARVIAFEPDPSIYKLLSENLERNRIYDVQLINAGLSADDGDALFAPDGRAGGKISGEGLVRVRMERLSKYIDGSVDFLKLNIEGAEFDVLTEVANSGRLRNVQELVLEYHGWPEKQQSLGHILNLLDQQGFRYLVHDFDAETCRATKPPFRLNKNVTWFCLVYAKRSDLIVSES